MNAWKPVNPLTFFTLSSSHSRAGRAQVLVASDAMTRGMDVDNVQNIVNYDAPVYAKTYVHRYAPV